MITREMTKKASDGIKSFESARLVNNTLSFELNEPLIVQGIRLIMTKTVEKLQMNTAMNSITFWSFRLTRKNQS